MISSVFSVIILLLGIYFTFHTGFVQKNIVKSFFSFLPKQSESKGISPFAAMCTTLAATLGTGNIVGVAVAISIGGPGALFWMALSGVFSMALSYAEGYLGVKYRIKNNDGTYFGGPFCYIEKGMGTSFIPLSKTYALLCALSGILGVGTLVQINSASLACYDFFEKITDMSVPLPGGNYHISVVLCSVVISLLTGLVISGGIGRIAVFSSYAVPVMSALYILFIFIVLVRNCSLLPVALGKIIFGAFNPSSVTGGICGSFLVSFKTGVCKGVFSNEAGLGTASITASASNTNSCSSQGLVCMFATFFDTVVMCTLTGLAIVVTDSWKIGKNGSSITSYALCTGTGINENIISFVLMVSMVFFSFTSIIGWYCYCESSVRYFFGNAGMFSAIYSILYVFAVFIGPFADAEKLWSISDVLNAFLSLPNLAALYFLRKSINPKKRL